MPFDDVLPLAIEAECRHGCEEISGVKIDPDDPEIWGWTDVGHDKFSPLMAPPVVLRPLGRRDQTLMVVPMGFLQGTSVLNLMAAKTPDLSIISASSQFENKCCNSHRFACWRNGALYREAMLTRGMSGGGFGWHVSGQPLLFKETERYASLRTDHRLNRGLLFEYLRAAGVDLADVLIRKEVSEIAVLQMRH